MRYTIISMYIEVIENNGFRNASKKQLVYKALETIFDWGWNKMSSHPSGAAAGVLFLSWQAKIQKKQTNKQAKQNTFSAHFGIVLEFIKKNPRVLRTTSFSGGAAPQYLRLQGLACLQNINWLWF